MCVNLNTYKLAEEEAGKLRKHLNVTRKDSLTQIVRQDNGRRFGYRVRVIRQRDGEISSIFVWDDGRVL